MPAAPTATLPAATDQPAATTGTLAATPDAGSSFDRFDRDIPETPAAAPAKPAAAKPDDKTKGAAPQAPAKPTDKPGDKPDDKATPAVPQAGADGMPPFKTNAELRKWAADRHKAAKTLEAEKSALEKRIQELSATPASPSVDLEQLNSRIATLQKEIDQKEQIIRLKDYQESGEFKEKFEKPFNDAYRRAVRKVKELLVTENTGQTDSEGNAITRERQATQADFDEIYQLPQGQAIRVAKAKFGDAYSDVMHDRSSLHELNENAFNAIQEWRTKASERNKQDKEQKSVLENSRAIMWQKANDALSNDDRRKHLWGKSDDPKANEELQKGFAFADRLYGKEYQSMPPEQQVIFDAMVRHRLAAFSRLAYEKTQWLAEREAFEKEIAELRESTPGKPTPAGEHQPEEAKTVLEAFDKAMKD